jgi:hypothetical protein
MFRLPLVGKSEKKSRSGKIRDFENLGILFSNADDREYYRLS